MDIIFKSFLKSPLLPLIISVQVAIAFAVCVNTTYVMKEQMAPIISDDGIRSPESLLIAWNVIPRGKPWPTSRIKEAESRLSYIAGVKSVAAATSVPFESGAIVQAEVVRGPGSPKYDTTIYVGDSLIGTLGLTLVEGRDFTAEEQNQQLPGVGFGQRGSVIISQELARRLFPDGGALGSTLDIVDASAPRTIVGIISNMVSNDLGADAAEAMKNIMIFPGIPGRWRQTVYALRVESQGSAAATCAGVLSAIRDSFNTELAPGLEVKCATYKDMRSDVLKGRRAAIWLLSGISLFVLLVALMGGSGLTSYWVQSRTRHIGIRRALGATQIKVLSQVLVENALMVVVGVVGGGS